MIFVDSNVPMYVIGAAHPNKDAAQRMLARAIRDEERLVTSAEVFREILHRYRAIDRLAAIAPAFALLEDLVDEVFAVTHADVRRASEIVVATAGPSARDALHLAVMERQGVRRIMTFDAAFDAIGDVERVVD